MTCDDCKHCDHINHAPIGSGRFELWCRDECGYMTEIENWTQPCERFENRWEDDDEA